MKNLILLSLMLLSFNAHSQYISGIYSGKLVNDSTKKEQNYELALSEYKGKITGYAYTTFVVNDTFYYSIKRVKATRVNGNLVVEDVKMLVNNFPESPAKRVKQTNIIPLNETQDTILSLNGTWKTNQTKEYYSIYGAVDMRKDNDSAHSTLVAHLSELKLIPPITGSASGPASMASNNKKSNTAGSGTQPANTNSTAGAGTVKTNAKTNTTAANPANTTAANTSTSKTTTAKTAAPNSTAANTTAANTTTANTTAVNATTANTTTAKATTKSKKAQPGYDKSKENNTAPVAPAYIPYNERNVTLLQEMDIVSDSIVLSFYDNGVVDGDMISVYINDQNVVSATKLTEAATKKTVHLNSFNSDSVTLILVAENMGTLPPNTGLLVVQDGAMKYQVRFSADLQTNAAIVFRKRK